MKAPAHLVRSVAFGLLALLSSGSAAIARDQLNVPGGYATIQAAIDAAAVGDMILVSPGTYVENLDYMGKDVIVRAVAGYTQTTIDGNQAGTVVIFENGETRDAVLDGFTITNGLGTLRPAGGIYCGDASPTIRACLIVANQGSDAMGGAGGLQGGFASPEIRNCIFRRNRGGAGSNPAGPGALKLRWNSSPNVISCLFEENRGADAATAAGAGVLRSELGSVPVFNSCEFRRNVGGNHAECDGAAGSGVASLKGSAVFRNSAFEANVAGRGELGAGVADMNSDVVFFTDCSFVENVGSGCGIDGGVDGGPGALYSKATSPQIAQCEFRGNRGGGRNAPGAIEATGIGGTRITDSTFVENEGGFGGIGSAGAILFDETDHGPSSIERCTFLRNVGGGGNKGGPGAVRAIEAGLIADCDFIENRGGDGQRGNGGPGALLCGNLSFNEVERCRFLGNVGGQGAHDQNDAPNAASCGAGGIEASGGDPVFRNCVVARNVGGSSGDYAPGTGGIEVGAAILLVNCTVVDNVAGSGPGQAKPAGLRFSGGGQRTVLNSIFWNDGPAEELTGTGDVHHCIVRGGRAGVGNLDLDPLLVDPDSDDFHLSCPSPCRDAGTFDAELPSVDYEGDARNLGSAVDIGVDEYSLPPAGSSYCTSTPNSTGMAALIDAGGCNAIADGILPLHAGPVPSTFGAFFYGTTQVQTPLGNGVRCVGGTVFRRPFVPAVGGELFDTLDYANPPLPAGQITAGSTWFFQAFYRDPAAGGAQVDLTDGLQITFVP